MGFSRASWAPHVSDSTSTSYTKPADIKSPDDEITVFSIQTRLLTSLTTMYEYSIPLHIQIHNRYSVEFQFIRPAIDTLSDVQVLVHHTPISLGYVLFYPAAKCWFIPQISVIVSHLVLIYCYTKVSLLFYLWNRNLYPGMRSYCWRQPLCHKVCFGSRIESSHAKQARQAYQAAHLLCEGREGRGFSVSRDTMTWGSKISGFRVSGPTQVKQTSP